MNKYFTDYMRAVVAAQRVADATGKRMAIKLVYDKGVPGFAVSVWNQGAESDSCRAEVIYPSNGVQP